MDTNETEPVEGEGATSPADTSQGVIQPAETSPDISQDVSDAQGAEAGEEAGEASKLLAGKYKTSEELEKGYTELQSKLGEVGQKAEIANLLEKTTGMSAQQIKDYLTQQEYARYQQAQQQAQADPGLAAYQEVQQLKSQMALQNEEKELDKFLNSNEGKPYTAFKDKILKLGLNLEKDKSYADIARDYFGESRAQGQQDAYKKIETKKMTQSSGVKSSPQRKFTIEDMRGMTSEEMRAILPHAPSR